MRTKNVILGIAAVLFAIDSAFASRLMVASDYISILYSSASSFKCTVITSTCNSSTTQLCKIDVILANGTIAQAQVYELSTDKISKTFIDEVRNEMLNT